MSPRLHDTPVFYKYPHCRTSVDKPIRSPCVRGSARVLGLTVTRALSPLPPSSRPGVLTTVSWNAELTRPSPARPSAAGPNEDTALSRRVSAQVSSTRHDTPERRERLRKNQATLRIGLHSWGAVTVSSGSGVPQAPKGGFISSGVTSRSHSVRTAGRTGRPSVSWTHAENRALQEFPSPSVD